MLSDVTLQCFDTVDGIPSTRSWREGDWACTFCQAHQPLWMVAWPFFLSYFSILQPAGNCDATTNSEFQKLTVQKISKNYDFGTTRNWNPRLSIGTIIASRHWFFWRVCTARKRPHSRAWRYLGADKKVRDCTHPNRRVASNTNVTNAMKFIEKSLVTSGFMNTGA